MKKRQVSLKPQDVFILLKIVALGSSPWSYLSLAHELGMSQSEVHQGVKRAASARLFDLSSKRPIRKAVEEFLVHGVKYAFPTQRGEPTRGVPTAHAAPPLSSMIVQSEEMPPVWPDPHGEVRGFEFLPLYHSVPDAARRDSGLYELLALVDAIRAGKSRERELATQELRRRLSA
jgi:hypothetical protein